MDDKPKVKTCSRCGQERTVDNFNKLTKNRYCSWCRHCHGYEHQCAHKLRKFSSDRRRASTQKSRARRYGFTEHFTADDLRTKRVQQQHKCYWCYQELGKDYRVDHIIALNKGGTNRRDNICLSCHMCNALKSDHMPWDFAGRLL